MMSSKDERSNENGQDFLDNSTTDTTHAPSVNKVIFFLITFRLANALILRTFFQPDEYYQALEPAWQLAFGNSAGAWITWSIIAAIGDYYTWRLGELVFGKRSQQAWIALALTVVSPWQWFCSPRTFSNCTEATLTIVALYNWPFHWSTPENDTEVKLDSFGLPLRERIGSDPAVSNEVTRLRRTIIFAALATILRPTNILIWTTLAVLTFVRIPSFRMDKHQLTCLIRESIMCGSLVLGFSILVDRIFYDEWTFPPLNFLHFNVVQSLAVFYGNNDWHYYISQGYPLLLTTVLPFGVLGILYAIGSSHSLAALSYQSKTVLHRLAIISLVLPAALSILAHKEVRFIYPLLPALHVLAANPLASFISSSFSSSSPPSLLNPSFNESLRNLPASRSALLGILLAANIAIASYTSLIHNSGLIRLPDYLRHEYEQYHNSGLDKSTGNTGQEPKNLTFAILMPCHSIPWRSHIELPPTSNQTGISGWALTCEPPLDLDAAAKSTYLDEADVFYNDPILWLKKNMSPRVPPASKPNPRRAAQDTKNKHLWGSVDNNPGSNAVWLQQGEGARVSHKRRLWPDYLAFFQQLEPIMEVALRGSGYGECARMFNSHWHDDWRRTGDIVVWCLYPERKST